MKFRHSGISLLTLLALLVTGAFAQDATTHFKEGYRAEKAKDYFGANRHYTAAISLVPTEPKYYLHRAISNQGLSQPNEARADLDRAIKLKPDYALAYWHRSQVRPKDDYDGRIADLNKTLEYDPGLILAYLSRGIVRYLKKDYKDSLKDLNKGLELTPAGLRPNFYVARGRTYLRMKKTKAALADAESAIAERPTHAPAFRLRSEIYEALREPDKARDDRQRAMALEEQ